MNERKAMFLALMVICIMALVPAILAQPAPQTLSPLPTPTCDPSRWYPPEAGCPIPPPATMPPRPTPLPTCEADQSGIGCIPFRPTPTPDAPSLPEWPGQRIYRVFLPIISFVP